MALRWKIFMHLRMVDYLKNRQLNEVQLLFFATTSNLLIITNLVFYTFCESNAKMLCIYFYTIIAIMLCKDVFKYLIKNKRMTKTYAYFYVNLV